MNRSARLQALLRLLRSHDECRVEELARELGVTARTVFRDLAALRDDGLPITGIPGIRGGVRLEGDRGVTAVHLSIGELVALWLAARLAGAATHLPWSNDTRSALRKVLASLSRGRQRELTALLGRVAVGPPASDAVRQSASAPPPELLRLVESAVSSCIELSFRYTDRHGSDSLRRVQPHGLLVQPPVWYILAHDLNRGAPRTFRMDRMARPQLIRSHRFTPNPQVTAALLADVPGWAPLRP